MSSVYEQEHFVQFYPQTKLLFDSLRSFMGAGIREKDACIVISTREHLFELENLLFDAGLDVAQARENSAYISRDAEATLALFMVDGLPDKGRFMKVMGTLLEEATKQGRPVRAFGEMVAILWSQGNPAAAILLEQFSNDIARYYTLTLFCAYPSDGFETDAGSQGLEAISRLHSSAINPAPSIP